MERTLDLLADAAQSDRHSRHAASALLSLYVRSNASRASRALHSEESRSTRASSAGSHSAELQSQSLLPLRSDSFDSSAPGGWRMAQAPGSAEWIERSVASDLAGGCRSPSAASPQLGPSGTTAVGGDPSSSSWWALRRVIHRVEDLHLWMRTAAGGAPEEEDVSSLHSPSISEFSSSDLDSCHGSDQQATATLETATASRRSLRFKSFKHTKRSRRDVRRRKQRHADWCTSDWNFMGDDSMISLEPSCTGDESEETILGGVTFGTDVASELRLSKVSLFSPSRTSSQSTGQDKLEERSAGGGTRRGFKRKRKGVQGGSYSEEEPHKTPSPESPFNMSSTFTAPMIVNSSDQRTSAELWEPTERLPGAAAVLNDVASGIAADDVVVVPHLQRDEENDDHVMGDRNTCVKLNGSSSSNITDAKLCSTDELSSPQPDTRNDVHLGEGREGRNHGQTVRGEYTPPISAGMRCHQWTTSESFEHHAHFQPFDGMDDTSAPQISATAIPSLHPRPHQLHHEVTDATVLSVDSLCLSVASDTSARTAYALGTKGELHNSCSNASLTSTADHHASQCISIQGAAPNIITSSTSPKLTHRSQSTSTPEALPTGVGAAKAGNPKNGSPAAVGWKTRGGLARMSTDRSTTATSTTHFSSVVTRVPSYGRRSELFLDGLRKKSSTRKPNHQHHASSASFTDANLDCWASGQCRAAESGNLQLVQPPYYDVPTRLIRTDTLQKLRMALASRKWSYHIPKLLQPPHVVESLLFRGAPRKTKNLKLVAGGLMKAHPMKLKGEDSFFVSKDGKAVGVADGVSEWRRYGINPRRFSDQLMHRCRAFLESNHISQNSTTAVNLAKVALRNAFSGVTAYGGSTAAVAVVGESGSMLEVANLGDSTICVLRRDPASGEMKIQFRSQELQHEFNLPFQLMHLPDLADVPELTARGFHRLAEVVNDMKTTSTDDDTPEDAVCYQVPLKEGDLVLVATDGVFDNLYEAEICHLASFAISPFEAAHSEIEPRKVPLQATRKGASSAASVDNSASRVTTSRSLRGIDAGIKSSSTVTVTTAASTSAALSVPYTAPRAIAKALVHCAYQRSNDVKAVIPFFLNAQKAGKLADGAPNAGIGGKQDDITLIAAWVVASEES